MLCGNDPRALARMTPRDRAAVRWYRDYLTWSKSRDEGLDVGDEPDFETYAAAAEAAAAEQTGDERP